MPQYVWIFDSEKKRPKPIRVGLPRFEKLKQYYGNKWQLWQSDVSGVQVEISKKKEAVVAVEVKKPVEPKIEIEITQEQEPKKQKKDKSKKSKKKDV